MGGSSSNTTQNTTNNDNRRIVDGKSVSADGAQGGVNVTYNDVSADTVKAALGEANKAFGTSADLAGKALDASNHAFDTASEIAKQSVTSSDAVAKAALENSRNTTADLIRSQDAAFAGAERLYSAAATGGATTAASTSADIAKLAVVGAVAVLYLTRK